MKMINALLAIRHNTKYLFLSVMCNLTSAPKFRGSAFQSPCFCTPHWRKYQNRSNVSSS